MQLTDEFYREYVPVDPWDLVDFRQWLLKKGWSNREFAEDLWIICSRDLLFYVSCFGWLLEPRDKARWQRTRPFGDCKEIPFIPRPYQEETFLKIQAHLGKKDILITKSREMGATWQVLYVLDWAWRFHPQMHFGLVSKDEDSVDSADNPDALMAKLDFIDARLPSFLQPGGSSKKFRNRNRSEHTIANLVNGSTFSGYSCTADAGRGGRKSAFFMDEMHAFPAGSDTLTMASTQHVTHCRIMCSTPNPQRGQAGVFYDIVQNLEADVERIVLDWKMDLDKSAGLYESDGGMLKILDVLYPYSKDYPFILDGKRRSPYYDYECRRPGASPRLIAAELDMDFGGATNRLFDPVLIQWALSQCRNPEFRCKLRQAHGTWLPVLQEDEKGDIEFWVPEDMQVDINDEGIVSLPQGRRFAMGCDVARGLDGAFSSCSAAVLIDTMSGKQVAEWRSARMKPVEFAEYAFFLGKAFNTALMNPEITGAGLEFLTRIIEMGYVNLWYRPQRKDSVNRGLSDRPGYDNRDAGMQLLGELQDAMKKHHVLVYSRQVVSECSRYFIDETGKLRHPLVGKGRVDAPEKSHGDSAIACGAAWWAVHEEPDMPMAEEEVQTPYGSFAWRQQQARKGAVPKVGTSAWDPLESKDHKIRVW